MKKIYLQNMRMKLNKQQRTYYDILGIAFDAKSDELKKPSENWLLNIIPIKT